MGTIMNGILGGFSGKVGTVIGASWNGVEYMRARASHITQPNTPAQLDQRARFGTMGKFLRPLIPFLRIGYKNQAIKMSAFNAAMAYNLENALMGTYPTYSVDYSKVQLSEGLLPEALNPEVTSTVAGQVAFTWDDNSDDIGTSVTDKALLVVYNPIKQRAATAVGGSTRADGSQNVTLPLSFSGDQVECYISFSNDDQSLLSNSLYVGSVSVM